jgi:hypothetical protein
LLYVTRTIFCSPLCWILCTKFDSCCVIINFSFFISQCIIVKCEPISINHVH